MCYICVTFSYIGVILMKKIFKVLAFMFLAVAVFSCNHSAKKGKASQASTNQTEDMPKFIAELTKPSSIVVPTDINKLDNETKTIFNEIQTALSTDASFSAITPTINLENAKKNFYKSEYFYTVSGTSIVENSAYLILVNANNKVYAYAVTKENGNYKFQDVTTHLGDTPISLNKNIYITDSMSRLATLCAKFIPAYIGIDDNVITELNKNTTKKVVLCYEFESRVLYMCFLKTSDKVYYLDILPFATYQKDSQGNFISNKIIEKKDDTMFLFFEFDTCTYDATKRELKISENLHSTSLLFKQNNNGTITMGGIDPDNTYHEYETLKLVFGELSDLAE